MTGRAIIPGAIAIAVALVVALATCGEAQREEVEEAAATTAAQVEGAAATAWVDQMAAVANAIERQPTAADSILAANEMTRAKFDSLLYVIAADSELSARFEGLRTPQ